MEIRERKAPFTWGIESINKAMGKPDLNELIVFF